MLFFYSKLAFSTFPTDSPTTQTQKLKTQTQYPTNIQLIFLYSSFFVTQLAKLYKIRFVQ